MVKNIYPNNPTYFRFSERASIFTACWKNCHKGALAFLILAVGYSSSIYAQTYCPSFLCRVLVLREIS